MLTLVVPIVAHAESVRTNYVSLFERMVVDFPADEAVMWRCCNSQQQDNGDCFEIWQHIRTDADERVAVATLPWEGGIQKTLEQVVSELIVPYTFLPLGEKIEIKKEFKENEAWVTARLENVFFFCYRVIVTPFGSHLASFTHQSSDTSLVDPNHARIILQEYCSLVI